MWIRTPASTCLVALALAFTLGGALGQDTKTAKGFFSGSRLYEECFRDHPLSYGFCLGFVAGVTDTYFLLVASNVSLGAWRACIGANVTAEQIRNAVKHYLALHPETRDYMAADLVSAALAEEFPCE